MALPNSQNEVTARRLAQLIGGAGGLWEKIKSLVDNKSDAEVIAYALTELNSRLKVLEIYRNNLGTAIADSIDSQELFIGGTNLIDLFDAKLDLNGNGKDVKITFTTASSAANLASNETLSTLIGKIDKWIRTLNSGKENAITWMTSSDVDNLWNDAWDAAHQAE